MISTVAAQNQTNEDWRETEPVKVIVDSTADWGRILFDDLNGTNSNGIRVRSVVSSGWMVGKDDDDVLDVGRKIPWRDAVYNQTVIRKGDLLGFFKGLRDFQYTEAYAVLIFDVNVNLPQVYVWLMTGGIGTTTFEIVSQSTGGTIWRDIVVGSGETQQVKRVMSPQPFFRTGRSENAFVVAWLSIAIIVTIVLNFPVLEVLRRRLRRKRVNPDPERRERRSV